MMDARAFLIQQLRMGEGILEQAAADLTDSECLAQLPGGGQTANWIFGHLATSEDMFLFRLTGAALEIAPDVHDKYKAGETPSTDPKENLPKSEVVALFKDQRQRVISALETADTSDWDQPPPEGVLPQFGSVGGTWGVIGTHQFWHLGQLTAIRRMLGKPPLME